VPDPNKRRRRLVTGQLNPDNRVPADEPAVGGSFAGSLVDDRFRSACGVSSNVVVTVRHREWKQNEPVRHTIGHPSVLIGRDVRCDIALRDPIVSYRHTYLQLLDGQLLCFDLASRSGTFCRSDRHRSGPLELGEEIFIGPFSLTISTEESESGNEAGGPLVPADGLSGIAGTIPNIPSTVLKFMHGSPNLEPMTLNRPVTLIGESNRCRVKLTDGSVSQVHCSIVRTQTGVWVVDLLGKGGTLVDGKRVTRTPLHEGDELSVGDIRMQIFAQ